MKFKTKKVLTGILPKTSAKTGKPYVMLNYLNDNGSTFSSILADNVHLPEGLKQLSNVNVEFEVSFYNGNVTGLRTTEIAMA